MTGPGRPPIGTVRETTIPDDLWDATKAAAKAAKVSAAEIVRRSLAAYLGRTWSDGHTIYTGWPINGKEGEGK